MGKVGICGTDNGKTLHSAHEQFDIEIWEVGSGEK